MASLSECQWAPCGVVSRRTESETRRPAPALNGNGSLYDSRWAPASLVAHATCSQQGKSHQKQKREWSLTPPHREAKEVFTTTEVTVTIHLPSREAAKKAPENSTKMNDFARSAPISNLNEQVNEAIAAIPDDDLYHLDRHGIPDIWHRRHISASSQWMPYRKALDKYTYRNMRPAFQLASYILQKSENWMMRLIDAPTVMHVTPGSNTASLQLDPYWKPSIHARKKLQIVYDSLHATMRLFTAHGERVACAGGHGNPHGTTLSWLDQNNNVCHNVSFNERYHDIFSREDYASLPNVTRNAVSCMFAVVLVHETCHCLWKIRTVEGFAQGEGATMGATIGPATGAARQIANTELAIVVPGTNFEQYDMGLHWEIYLLGGILYMHTEKGIWDGVEDLAFIQGLAIGLPEGMMLINEFAEAVLDEVVQHQLDECYGEASAMTVLENDIGGSLCLEQRSNLLDGIYDVIEGSEREQKLRRLWRAERRVAGDEIELGDSCMSTACWKRWEEIQRDDV